MAKKQTRRSLSFNRALHEELLAFCALHDIPAAQVAAQGLRAILDGVLPLLPVPERPEASRPGRVRGSKPAVVVGHDVSIESYVSASWVEEDDSPANVVRWACSCGKRGQEYHHTNESRCRGAGARHAALSRAADAPGPTLTAGPRPPDPNVVRPVKGFCAPCTGDLDTRMQYAPWGRDGAAVRICHDCQTRADQPNGNISLGGGARVGMASGCRWTSSRGAGGGT